MMKRQSFLFFVFSFLTVSGCASVKEMVRNDSPPPPFFDEQKVMLSKLRNGSSDQAGTLAAGTKDTTAAVQERSVSQPQIGEQKVSAQTNLNVYLSIINGMMDKGLYYAAIAHLDALGEREKALPEAQLLRAEALRYTGQKEAARQIYAALVASPVSGQAYRGLGLLAAADGKLDEAVGHFELASRLRPTDAKVRNDLGYSLLLCGRLDQARVHLATARELSRNAGPSTVNMILLLFLEGREADAVQLAKDNRVEELDVARLRLQAAELRAQIWSQGSVQPPPAAANASVPVSGSLPVSGGERKSRGIVASTSAPVSGSSPVGFVHGLPPSPVLSGQTPEQKPAVQPTG